MSVASLFAPRYKGGLQQRGLSGILTRFPFNRHTANRCVGKVKCFYVNGTMFLHKCFKFNISAGKQRVDRHDGTVHRHKAQELLPEHGPRHRDRKAESNRTKGLLTPKKRHGESSMNVKGHLLRRKRYPFRLQKMVFQEPKDHLLQHAEYQYIMKAHEKRSVLPQNQPAH